ncbi:MATE family efflux transporter [Psychromonas hadalis]|uniref:MATE family efflux transporter n=1 Tax=Psychromonas hadalis TaxID=211669 RepID=UPI0003B5E12A|nr:MATE family efflux transporter [Psychromonas hadalis]
MQTDSPQLDTPQINSDDSVSKTYWRYAIPSIFAMLVNGLYQVVDGIFVGHYLGSTGLAAINMTIPILAAVAGFGIMIGMGGGSLMSQYRGEQSIAKEQGALASSIFLIVLLSLLVMIILMLFSGVLLDLQGATGQVLQFSQDYLQVFSYGVLMTIGAATLPMLIRNDNSPTCSTLLIVMGAVLNIILDYLFIAVWQLGLQGVAIATVISQSVVVLIALAYFFSHYSQCKIKFSKINVESLYKTVHLGASSLFMFFYFGFVIALHNKLFMSYGSTVHVAAFAIVGYVATLYYLIAEGIASGLQPPVSYYFGAKQTDKIIATLTLACKVVLISGITMVLMLNLFPSLLIELFSQGEKQLTEAATIGIHLHLFALFLDGFLFIVTIYYMAVGQANKALWVSMGNMLVQLPFLYFLPLWLGVNGVWLAVPLSNILLTLIVAPLLWKDLQSLKLHGSHTVEAKKHPKINRLKLNS